MMQKYPAYKDSGFDWLKEVPEHWEQKSIRTLTKVKTERNKPDLPLLSVYRDYGVIYKDSRDDNHNRAGMDLSSYKVVAPNNLVLNKMKTWQGSLGVSQLEGIVSPAYIVCDLDEGVNGRYLNYLLRCRSYVHAYNRISYGVRVDQWDMRYEDFKQLPVFLPSSDEQAAIVAFLEEQTAVINQFLTNKRRLIELLEEQKQVVINTAVTQGLETAVVRKPSGIDWLGDIPAHWEIKKIGYIAEVGNGSTPSRSNMRYWQDGTYPWLNSSSVNQGVITEADQFVTPTALGECHLPIVKPNSILVAITGQGKTRGTAALLTFEATINQHMAYITPSSKVLSADYLVTFLQGNYNYLRYISDGQGGTKGALTCGDIKQLKIPVPPPPEQEIIIERVKQTLSEINTAIERTQREIELIEEYRTTLIATAVTGKIDVRSYV